MYLDSYQLIIILITVVIGGWAQYRVSSAYRKYSRLGTRRGLTGAEIAKSLLRGSGSHDVKVGAIAGEMTDHYDPRSQELNLSEGVYNSPSIAAVSIAAHEVGHAIQHHVNYFPLHVRNMIVPVVSFGSNLVWPVIIGGMIFNWGFLLDIGIYLYAGIVAFHLITLPVELDASKRALALLNTGGYLQADELTGAKKVLSAAAMTYIAATLVAILTLIRLLILRNSND
ncbi:zinc metallopeptidase [candidate division KSB1 bacterium]|nr:zinc metallopeptidase [candidate division KSB1 bacterium]